MLYLKAPGLILLLFILQSIKHIKNKNGKNTSSDFASVNHN